MSAKHCAFALAATGLVAAALPAAAAAPMATLVHRGPTPAPTPAPHRIPATLRTPSVAMNGQSQAVNTDTSGNLSCRHANAKNYCYLPTQIYSGYDIYPLLSNGDNGAGQTIAIIDAFQDPTLASDVAHFNSVTGLAALNLTVVAPNGLTPFDSSNSNQVSWSSEIAIDVEWAHAIAPGAKVELILAPSDSDQDLINAETYAVNNHVGNVVSMSYTEAESCETTALRTQESNLFASGAAAGMSFFAASGDVGAAQHDCTGTTFSKAVATPASNPNVTGVGGTDLTLDQASGAYISETVWNEPGRNQAAGGGFSSFYSRPSWQPSSVGSARGVPDVSYSAALAQGVYVSWGSSPKYKNLQDWVFSGTSVGTPQWAALTAIADQIAGHGLGNVNPKLYASASDFHDVTAGNNTFQAITGYSAGPGWDAASGLGSPDAALIVADLAR